MGSTRIAPPAGLVLVGREVRVHRNLNNNTWSVRTNGFKTFHVENLIISFADFFVSASGRMKVREKRQRSVHAWCKGTVLAESRHGATIPISYNPYDPIPCFVHAGTQDAIYHSLEVHFSTDAEGKLHCLANQEPF